MKASSTFITRSICSVAAVAALGGAGLSMAPSASAAPVEHSVGGAPWSQTFDYTGGVQWVTVPPDTDQLDLQATGGDGGAVAVQDIAYVRGGGAVVKGDIAVTPGEKVAISVGGQGEMGGTGSSDPRGGWGGLGMDGGNGNGASDHLRTSAAGGGATVVQIENADGSDLRTILIAAGGGGNGGASGDLIGVGTGGAGGAGWTGQNGTDGSHTLGGSGGHAGTQTSGAGARGSGGSGLGGNGGGGGGGVAGGSGGGGAKGTSAGGGGGSGTSATYDLTGTSISQRYGSGRTQSPSNGEVIVTWMDV